MNDALRLAQQFWGPGGSVKKAGPNFQMRCTLSDGNMITVATSKVSWEDAIAKVDTRINGPHLITATATDTLGNPTESAPILVYVCNGKTAI